MQIEFIAGSRVEGLSDSFLFDFILDRVLDDKIIVLEKELDYEQQMELIARGLEKSKTETTLGIRFFPFFVKAEVTGLLRNKHQEVQFNLIAPGTTLISETADGLYSVTSEEGEVFSASF